VDSDTSHDRQGAAVVPPFLTNVRFVCCDLAVLDLQDASADVVISNAPSTTLQTSSGLSGNPPRSRPGGRLWSSDVIAESELPESVRSDPAAWAACYGGAIPEPHTWYAIRNGRLRQRRGADPQRNPTKRGGVFVRSLTVRGNR